MVHRWLNSPALKILRLQGRSCSIGGPQAKSISKSRKHELFEGQAEAYERTGTIRSDRKRSADFCSESGLVEDL